MRASGAGGGGGPAYCEAIGGRCSTRRTQRSMVLATFRDEDGQRVEARVGDLTELGGHDLVVRRLEFVDLDDFSKNRDFVAAERVRLVGRRDGFRRVCIRHRLRLSFLDW